MSYQVLARKWRPRSFQEMVGQEHVTQALINALDQGRLHHAYLFSGTRGIGKTTVARILAKCLNCANGVGSVPCDTCSPCTEIAEGRSMDLIEVDAASRTKVEDTRELLDNVQYAPSSCRFKVYLIDEVHMLSTSSFNALLKTLEEPPGHVKFLLATTEPQKLPATVLSRCLQFNLKNMVPDLIVRQLHKILQEEGAGSEEAALWLLARAADGSMRDALSLLDQALAFGSGQLLEAEVRDMLGSVDFQFVHELLMAIAGGEALKALEVVQRLAQHAPDYAGILQELVALLHRVAVAQAVPDATDKSWGDADQVLALARQMSAEDVQLYYQIALAGRRDIGYSADLRSGLEMTLLRMIAFRPSVVIDETLAGAELLPVAEEAAAPVKKPEPPGPPASGGKSLEPEQWAEMLDQLGLRGPSYNVASHTELQQFDGDRVCLVLDQSQTALYRDDSAEKIQQALGEFLQRPVQVEIETGVPGRETPAGRAQRLRDEYQRQLVASFQCDPGVKLLLDRFAGTLDIDSITVDK